MSDKINLAFREHKGSMCECSFDLWDQQQKCPHSEKNTYLDVCRFYRFEAYCQSEKAQGACARTIPVQKEDLPEDLNRGVGQPVDADGDAIDKDILEGQERVREELEGIYAGCVNRKTAVKAKEPQITRESRAEFVVNPWETWKAKRQSHGPDLGPMGHWTSKDPLERFMRKLKERLQNYVGKTTGFSLQNMWWAPKPDTDHVAIDMVYHGPEGVCGQATYLLSAHDYMVMGQNDDHLRELALRICDCIINQFARDRVTWKEYR
jgi:hypothetical protein